jgi:hypothetical protein
MTKKEKIVRRLHHLACKYQGLFHEINIVANDLTWACEEALDEVSGCRKRWAIRHSNEENPLFTNKQAALIVALQEESEQREEILDYGNTDVDPDILFERINKLKSSVQKRLKRVAKSKRKS